MSQVTYSLPFEGPESRLVLTSGQLIQRMFYGVKLCTVTGDHISEEDIKFYIRSAQQEVERYLGLLLTKQVVVEDHEFYRDDWSNWGMVRTNYPVVQPFELNGFVNTIRQITYPPSWLVSRKTSDERLHRRSIFLVPNQGGEVNQGAVVYSGITPHLGFRGMANVPSYWKAVYVTGFDKVPEDIVKTVSLLAAIPIYMILGNGIIRPGLSSQSISIDGLSQSLSTEAGGYTTRIKQITEQLVGTQMLKGLLPSLKDYYNAYEIMSC